MNCPHKDKQFPPCDVTQHRYNEDLYFCKICQESYNVRDIESPNWVVAIAAIITLILAVTLISESPVTPTTPTRSNPDSRSVE